MDPGSALPLARALCSEVGATLGDVFSFVSSLYFRGKVAYAAAFGRPPDDLPAALVISAGEGLVPVHENVTLRRLGAWRAVDIDERNDEFTRPLVDHAAALERAYGATTRFVLLGSVASDKYVRPLTAVFGDHLLFPTDFIGRGDMSRGALMLRAARDGKELTYMPVEGAIVKFRNRRGDVEEMSRPPLKSRPHSSERTDLRRKAWALSTRTFIVPGSRMHWKRRSSIRSSRPRT